MFKQIIIVKRKPGMSIDEFKHHYENVHGPLAAEKLPFLTGYRRNYLTPIPVDGFDEWAFNQQEYVVGYDAIIELEWENKEKYLESMAVVQGEAGEEFARDEEEFLDRSSMVCFFAETYETEFK